MKKIGIFIFYILLFGCSAESKNDEQMVKNTMLQYLEGMMNHQYSDEYSIKYGSKVFHPDVNELGEQRQYKTITEKLSRHPGINIVDKFTIESIIPSYEKVYPTQKIEDREQSYFVKVVFHAIAIQSNQGMEVLSKPIDIIEFYILGYDSNDKKYKIISSYPDPASLFIDRDYALSKIDLIIRITETKNVLLLENALKLVK